MLSRFFPAVFILTLAAAGRADITQSFSTNPLGGGAIVQGPDAANVNSRFTWNSGDGTLTAHYSSTSPTIKLLFPLGSHYTQNQSFVMTTTFKIPSGAFISPPDFGAQVPSFGLVNSATTGDLRATTGHFDINTFQFTEITQGTAYDLFTLDYYPTQDNTFGGNSLNLTTVQSAQSGETFNSRIKFGFANTTLPLDQFITATITYNAATHEGKLDWGGGTITSNLTGGLFDVDAFAITLWSDPNLAPPLPADPSGSPVGGSIIFDSFTVTAVPEPGTLALLACATLATLARRPRR